MTNEILVETDTYGVKYYKQSELSKVLYGVEELGFEDLDSFNEDSLKDILSMKLNDKGTTSFALANNYTKVQVLYSSYFVKAILAKQVDTYLTEDIIDVNVRDSKLVKEVDHGITIYKESEIVAVADIITEIAVTDFDKIADKVMDIIFNLNDVSTIDTSRTKLQVLYSSNLVKSAILKQLDDNLGEDLVSTDLRDSTLVKEAKATEKLDGTAVTFYLYKESELSNIVRAANELGIETMDDLNDTSKISDKIFTLFEKSTSDPTKEKIEIIYESNIIKSVVSTQLDNNLDSTLIDVNVRDSIYVKEALNITKIDGTAKTIYLYQKDEIRNIIDGANELDINSLDDFTNADKIKDKIFTLSDAAKKDSTKQKIDILNESYIVRGVLAKQLDDNLGDTLIDSTIRDSKLVKDFENVELVTGSNADIALYSTTEIKAIINSAKELDISKIDDFTDTSVIKGKIFTLNDAATTTTGTKLDVLYSSNIVIGVLAKQLDGNLGDTIIDQELRDSKLIKEILVAEQQDGTNLNTYIYKKVEISYIIDGANELGIESIDDFTDSSVIKGKIFTLDEQAASDNTKQKLDILYQSNIVKGVLAKQLDTNLTSSIMNEDIRDSKLVKDFEATTKISNTDEVIAGFYKKTEILQIIKSADELGFDNIDDLTDTNKVKNKLFTLNDPATTTTGKKIDVLLSSNIIRSVLAVQLDENIGDTIVDLKVRDSLLVKEKITAEKANGTNAYVYLYTNDEVKTIISSAKELDITSVDDFTNFDVIKGKIFTLSDQAVTDNTKKKMEVLYSSNIIKSILTKQLDTNLDESIISVDVKNSELTKDKVEAVQLDNSSVNVYLYKETEVYGIINSAKELDITTVADFNNSDTIKNKIFTLYDTAVTDNSKSKIEVMYASFIIKSAFTKQLDDNLDSGMIDANVLDSRLVKHKYETISTSGTDIVCNLYEDSEVYGIINSARELEITSIDNLDGDNVKNKILTLNGPSLTDSTKSKLDILYTSYIIRSAVSTQLDNTLGDGNTADLGVLNSRLVKEKKATTKVSTDEATKFDFYIKDEISILIVSLDEIGITNISSFNSASVKNNVLHLNEQAKSDNTRTKLDVIYGSYIIQSAILKQLDTYLDDTFMNIDVRDSRLVKTGLDTYDLGDVAKTVSLYTQSEVRHLIDSATELDITTLDGFDADSVKDKIMNLNDESITDAPNTKLDVLYQSNIIQSVITTQIDSNIGSTLVADSVKDSTAAKSTYATYDLDDNDIVVALYKKYEVSSLINALDIIGITDISSVDTDTVGDSVFSLDDAKLTELYKSVIITYALSKKLDESFVNLNADTALLNEKKSNEFSANGVDYYMSTNKYYLKSEVLLIINAIGADGLGKSSLADVEAIDANVILGLNEIPAGKTKTRLEVIYESDILKNIVSDKLDTALDSNTAIVNDPIAKYDLLDLALYVYKIHEIEVLIDCLNHFGVTDIDTVDASTLALDNTFKGYVLDSSILFSTVSKQIIDNDDLVRPSRSLVTQNVITKVSSDEEMTHILNALIKLGVTDVTASISISLNSNIITEVSTSDILRATVTDKILANNVIVYVTNVKDATITDKTVITSEEMTAFLTAITDGFGMSDVEINSFTSADLALPAKADPDLDDKLDILASSVIMRATITSKLELQNNSYEDYDIYTLEDNADVYYNKNNDQVVSLKKIELVNTMKGVVYLTDGGTVQAQFSLATLAGLSDSELQIVLASGMFRIVTDALLDTYPAITMGKVQVSENMYLVSDCTSKVDNILTAEDEYEIIVNARAYLSTL